MSFVQPTSNSSISDHYSLSFQLSQLLLLQLTSNHTNLYSLTLDFPFSVHVRFHGHISNILLSTLSNPLPCYPFYTSDVDQFWVLAQDGGGEKSQNKGCSYKFIQPQLGPQRSQQSFHIFLGSSQTAVSALSNFPNQFKPKSPKSSHSPSSLYTPHPWLTSKATLSCFTFLNIIHIP